jgi:NTP pyrophosphatase (non-canonical NTP hydrolase)
MKDTLTKKALERLIILGEECNEVAQVISKIQRFGINNWNPITNEKNIDLLVKEMGDVIMMVSIVCEELEIPWESLEAAAKAKKEKLKRYTTHS